jgi:Cys-tRNA(Pro)/Cys-tRNA(Cys) deacylase
MLPVAEAERITGYRVGGISPFGQRRRVRVFIDESALAFTTVMVNGGRRGLEIEVAPGDIMRLLEASAAKLA